MKTKYLPLLSFLFLLPLQAQEELTNVAAASLGATAKGSNAKFNKDWPAQKTLGSGRSPGAIFSPFEGATIDLRFVMPVDVEFVEVGPNKRYNMKYPSGIEIYVDGKKLAASDLPASGDRVKIPVKVHTQNLRLVVTGSHPRQKLKNGKLGPDWGGLGPIQVWTSTDVKGAMALPDSYAVAAIPEAVQPTAPAKGDVEIFVDIRQTEGHPRTFWDQQDIDEYKEMLKSSEVLQEQLAALERAMDELIVAGVNVPEPRKGDDGKWLHLPVKEVGAIHNRLGLDLSNLGMTYALTGKEKYAEFAKELFLAYAEAFPNYGAGNRPGFNHDSGIVFDQRLGDATWLIQVARGYDLIYNLPSITDEERQLIEENLLRKSAEFIAKNSHVLRGATNWSAICTTAVLITGIVLEDQEMTDLALYGPGGTKENPKGGVILHFSEKTISPDGLWSEGAMGYQGMAMQALVADAEILRHHGMDMYSYRDAAFKNLFNSPIEMAYPDLTAPATNDSGRASIVGREAYLWEYGYLRYRDPRYLTILSHTGKSLAAKFQQFPVSIMYGDVSEGTEAFEWKSKNFFDVGYGILRNTSKNGTVNLLMDTGKGGSHDHPDKLNIDVYAFGDQLIPDPGIVWYEQPLYKNWYANTIAHNTVVVNMLNQKRAPSYQLTFLSGDRIGMQRGNSGEVYTGVMVDRSLFMTQDYIADIYGAFASLPRLYDLPWHIRGEVKTELEFDAFKFKAPMERGYSELINIKATTTSDPYKVRFELEAGTAIFHASGGEETQVILGDGWLRLERPTTIIQRRETGNTIYGNVVELDVDGESMIKDVQVSGTLEDGYGLLEIKTLKGKDLCFTAFRAEKFELGGLSTDAQQAYVSFEEGELAIMSIVGGSSLVSEGNTLQRSEAGNALLEKNENGAFVLANASPSAARIRVEFSGLDGLKAFALDKDGQRSGQKVKMEFAGKAMVFDLEANARIEFAKPDAESLYAYRQRMLHEVQAEAEAAAMKDKNEALARYKVRLAEAKELPIPAGTQVVVQAEDFTGEGEGKVGLSSKKKAIVGKAFAGWNNSGHWLEYTVEAPAEGYYNLSLVYCTALGNGERLLEINGEEQEPFAPVTFEVTGGWANNSDDWKLHTAMNPAIEKPLLIKLNKGENVLKLINSSGTGINLDYLLITSPDVTPVRLKAE
ncbi:heparinase II/III family protein [Kiritimatiellaeota bacterium B1221]|nr:heparinase II/III family protein [Kiritimatiellaeota bacterium B1221]